MSEFLSFLPPPGKVLAGYNSRQLHTEQIESIPEVFRHAMSIRESVYVEEQKVPLENEFDDDDPRSYHWVAYASVGTSGGSGEQKDTDTADTSTRVGQSRDSTGDSDKAQEQASQGRKSSTANKVAVGTIRLVPPPHPPHPEPGSSHKIDNAEGTQPDVNVGEQNAQHHYTGPEPYIKLGRLAVLQPFRGLGLAALLINAALQWAAQNPNAILPPMTAAAAEHRRLELGGGAEVDDLWKGLVLVHAQKAIEKVWKRYGFTTDESMGVWDEEGIDHIGMWRRLDVSAQARKASV